MKMKILSLFISILLLTLSCNKTEDKIDACGVENPQENIEWLKAKLDNRFCTEIYSIYFKGKEYISVCDCPQMRDGMIVIYDCQGTKVCEWGGIVASGTYNMPPGFSYEYYEIHKKFIYKKEEYPEY